MTGLLIACDIFNMPNNKKNVSCFTTLISISPHKKKDAVRAISNTYNCKMFSAPTPHSSNKHRLGQYTHSIRWFLYQAYNHTGYQQHRLKPQEPPELTLYI